MKHASLFSGIGGFDLAASWMGWENIFHCENNPFCLNVLRYYWPEEDSYEDIKTFNAIKYRGAVDVLSGGFPCQPFSAAGKRKGKADDRYLWPEALRIIKELRPKWIVFENVAGLFNILEPESLSEMEMQEIKLFCTDDENPTEKTIIRLQRRIIGTIIQDLWSVGYLLPQFADETPIILCIPACSVDAPHRRDRIWIIANTNSDGCRWNSRAPKFDSQGISEGVEKGFKLKSSDDTRVTADANSFERCQGRMHETANETAKRYARTRHSWDAGGAWKNFPTESPVRRRDDGIPCGLDGIAVSKYKNESLKAYGNAIVPQVALELFRIIEKAERVHPAS